MNARDTELSEEIDSWIVIREFQRARRPCERLLARTLAAHGPRHRDTAAVQQRLGRILLSLDQPKEALALFDQALTGYQTSGKRRAADRSSCLVDIFKAKKATGATEAAWSALTEAGSIRRDLFAPDSPEISEVLCLASIERFEDKKRGHARPLAANVIEVAQLMYGAGYLACLSIEHMLSVCARELQLETLLVDHHPRRSDPEIDAVAWLGEWLVERYAELFGPHNQRLLDPLEGLADLYEQRGAVASAVSALERKRAIQEGLSDLDPGDRTMHLNDLDRLYARAGDLPKQIAVLKELLAVQEADVDDDDHSAMAEVADRLGTAYLANGELDAAVASFKRATTFEPVEEPDQSDAVLYEYHLGNAYEAHGRSGERAGFRKALRTYRRALSRARHWLGNQDELVGSILSSMGNVLSTLKEHGEAIRCHRLALDNRKAEDGDESDLVCQSLNDLGLALYHAGQYREARRLLARALPVAERVFTSNPLDLVPLLNSLGLACAGCKDYGRAIKCLARVVRIIEDLAGASSIKLIEQLQNLGDVCALAGRKEEAETAYRRALGISVLKQGADAEDTKELQSCLERLAAGKLRVHVGYLWMLQSDRPLRDEPDTANASPNTADARPLTGAGRSRMRSDCRRTRLPARAQARLLRGRVGKPALR